jgi:hypothetical protein
MTGRGERTGRHRTERSEAITRHTWVIRPTKEGS